MLPINHDNTARSFQVRGKNSTQTHKGNATLLYHLIMRQLQKYDKEVAKRLECETPVSLF